MSCFDDINLENVNHCPNDETVAGLATKLNYIPEGQVETLTLPTVTDASTYEERVTIAPTGLVPVTGKGFKEIDILVDQNELKTEMVGTKGNMKLRTQIEAFIPGFKAKVVGFLQTHKNTPMIFSIVDSTGTRWVIGDKNNPAFIESAPGTTGKTFEDNSGMTVTITANCPPRKYAGTITLLADA